MHEHKTNLEMLAEEAAAARSMIDRFPYLVEEYLLVSQYPETVFGRACGCGIDLVRHIRVGRDLRHRTLRKCLDFIARAQTRPV